DREGGRVAGEGACVVIASLAASVERREALAIRADERGEHHDQRDHRCSRDPFSLLHDPGTCCAALTQPSNITESGRARAPLTAPGASWCPCPPSSRATSPRQAATAAPCSR